MYQELSSTLRQLGDDRASSLDKLIYADALDGQQLTCDVLIFEDATYALSLWALADAVESSERIRIFVRMRSYAQTHELYTLVKNKAPQALQQLMIAGLTADGHIMKGTFTPEDFMEAHGFAGRLAMGRLPKSHGALADWAAGFATHQYKQGLDARLVLGGNTKHMSTTFNSTLEQHFATVRGLRGKGKNRCIEATGVQRTAGQARPEDTPTGKLQAFGGVFSGAKADRGGQLLATAALTHIRSAGQPLTVLDFGCGNGSVSHQVLAATDHTQVSKLIATDIDMDAVRSATANLGEDARATITWDDAVSQVADHSIDLVLLNPPFHDGTTVDLTMVQPLLDASARVLTEGGTLLLVHNSHARYRSEIAARFGRVEQITRDKTFTVLSVYS